MEWYTLDDNLQLDEVIQGFESFIWTERYSAFGDFQIVTKSTTFSRRQLIPGKWITMAGSYYVAIIDTVTDGVDENGVRNLTVIGKFLENLLNDRVAMPSIGDTTTTPNWVLTGTPGDIARELFNRICVNTVLDVHDTIPYYSFGTLLPTGNLPEPSEIITVTASPDTLYNTLKSVCDTYSLGFRLVRSATPADNGGTSDISPTFPIMHIGAAAGPDGLAGQTLAQFTEAQTTIGPLTGIKMFYSFALGTWTTPNSSGMSPAAVVAKYPDVIPILCWNTQMTDTALAAFVNSVPAGQVVGLSWQQEPEGGGKFDSGADFISGWNDQVTKFRAVGNPNILAISCHTWGQYMPAGNAVTGSYIPDKDFVDYAGIDIYQHQAGGVFNGATTWPSNGLANHVGFQKWKSLCEAKGLSMAVTEYGVDDNGTLDRRNARIQLDYAYLKTAFQSNPLFMLLYWWHNMDKNNTHYKFTDTPTVTTWKNMAVEVSIGNINTGSSATSASPAGSGQIFFEVYTGNDLTTDQSIKNAIVFDADLDNLEKINILSSTAVLKNVAYVYASNGAAIVYAPTATGDEYGADRKVLLVNSSNSLEAGPDLDAALRQEGVIALAAQTTVYSFDGELPQQIPYIYGRDYNLGDLVEERNSDGVGSQMLVTEQIFSADNTGERAYPTLTFYEVITPGSWLGWPATQVWDDVSEDTHWDDL